MKALRIDQLLARFGYATRREAGAWVKRERVTTDDGEPLRDVAIRVDPSQVRVDGKPIEFPHGLLVAFHKPVGYVCSHDPREGPTLYDLLPSAWMARQPKPESVGRLDKETSGLIFLCDDGQLIHRWTSPRHEVEKVYEVETAESLPTTLGDVFASGTLVLRSETTPCRPARYEQLGPTSARLTLTEGRYHQVRRMFASQGCPVTQLHRVRIGSVALGTLAPGAWRALAVSEVGH
jgi:16S rRNA pseudouridine516 synthase